MEKENPSPAQGRLKFIIGGVLILAAIIYLIISSTSANAQYFLTVDELLKQKDEMVNRDLRISGVVIGDTIHNDLENQKITFTIAHIPGDNKEIEAQGGMGMVLHKASTDASLPRVDVVYYGVQPDLLKNEAQAILTGQFHEDGVFYADELLLKCPTKYEEAVPEQVEEN